MSNERVLTALGFARKAGKAASGELSAEKALKSGRAKLCVLDEGVSQNSRERWENACKNAGVPLIFAEGVGKAIGREAHTVACITDTGLAQMAMSGKN
ncbi:MAG: ribosomal L7Ae/L30e/S12e/Gadd45 family protein [Clostridia bacterium]|jgi:ribosomal protein L7Ae-like RNA K-turn-binding protein|nr:ribosomal L7Ae/L30e/S12e/Gadd45 family protein [Clostridia bacterium]MBQ4447131.1 ribosomal L7Ae/L30e/S12e/Gadd45 family protein [Clostridia bacterium]MBR3486674.1 ribosomal L7Ae/L30e/S12e/Gadd45 family protein [Clostridia bacterium]